MARRIKVTNRMIEEYLGGAKRIAIAAEYGVHESAIVQVFKRRRIVVVPKQRRNRIQYRPKVDRDWLIVLLPQ